MSAGQESGSPIRENRTLLPAPLPPDEARGTLAAAAGLSTVGLRPPFDSPAAAFSSRLSRRSHLDCRAAPQQGYDKQDCESRAARRWLALNGLRYSKLNPVYLGDDIYLKQPVCEEILAVGAHFLFVCKPDSHKTMNEYLSGVEVPSLSRKVKRGKKFFTYTWRWMLGLPIRDGKDALEVNWLEITIHDSNRKITYRNSFITDLPVDADNVEHLAAAGRARWKIENETFNTLKTKGYNLEHNFGHGKNNLSAVLATLNLIAFAIHLAAQLADKTWKAAIEVAD